eukprot:6760446-Alexandrium_andersonii.AAC.1
MSCVFPFLVERRPLRRILFCSHQSTSFQIRGLQAPLSGLRDPGGARKQDGGPVIRTAADRGPTMGLIFKG